MERWLPIEYRDFWDVPRVMVVRAGSAALLLDCRFDDAVDDYADMYDV